MLVAELVAVEAFALATVADFGVALGGVHTRATVVQALVQRGDVSAGG